MQKWDDNDVLCGKCGKICSQSNTEWLEKAPKRLIMRLQRAHVVGSNVEKLFTKVDLPNDKVNLSLCGEGGISGDVAGSSYELYAAVKHRGRL